MNRRSVVVAFCISLAAMAIPARANHEVYELTASTPCGLGCSIPANAGPYTFNIQSLYQNIGSICVVFDGVCQLGIQNNPYGPPGGGPDMSVTVTTTYGNPYIQFWACNNWGGGVCPGVTKIVVKIALPHGTNTRVDYSQMCVVVLGGAFACIPAGHVP